MRAFYSSKSLPRLMPSDFCLVFASLIVQNGIQLWFSSVFSFFTSLLLPVILSFHVSSFVKCLFMFSAYFSVGSSYLPVLCIYKIYIKKHSFYIFWTLTLGQLCATVAPQFSACLFTTVMVT